MKDIDPHQTWRWKLAFANNLGHWRHRQGLRQEDVAAALGTSKSFVAEMESTKASPRLEHLHRLAALFGVAVSDLIDERKVLHVRSSDHPC